MKIEYYVIQYRYTGIPNSRWHTYSQHYETLLSAQTMMKEYRKMEVKFLMASAEYRICAAVRTVRLVPIKSDSE